MASYVRPEPTCPAEGARSSSADGSGGQPAPLNWPTSQLGGKRRGDSHQNGKHGGCSSLVRPARACQVSRGRCKRRLDNTLLALQMMLQIQTDVAIVLRQTDVPAPASHPTRLTPFSASTVPLARIPDRLIYEVSRSPHLPTCLLESSSSSTT